MYRLPRSLISCLALVALLAPTSALADSRAKTERVTADLLSEDAALVPGETTWVALRLKIIPNWHTYWRNPGDSGEPTSIDWTLPDGFEAGKIHWPPPERLPVGPLTNYGYSNEAVHLVPIRVPKNAETGSTVTLTADSYWLVCEKVCIPEQAKLTLTMLVMPGPAQPNPETKPIFDKARAALPKPAPWPAEFAFRDGRFMLGVKADGLRRDRIEDVWFYPFEPGAVIYSAPQEAQFEKGGLTLSADRAKSERKTSGDLGGLLVFREKLDDGATVTQAFAIEAKPSTNGGALAVSSAGLSMPLWQAALFALLGGLILNLMPCVLPVLAMKALSFARHGAGGQRMGRHGLAYTGGVLATFAAVGAVLIAVKAAGAAIGWGFQLQEPIFVMVMAYLMFVIGLNFAGVFEFGGRLMGVGQSLTARGGLTGSFFTGVLAVVVATPCTAPFMGPAIGVALTQPWAISMAIVLALGLGLALPFLLLSLSPALLRFLPKPGPWMERFKQFLAFPMFATAAWLVWVLGIQAGDTAVLAVLAGAILIAFALWLFRTVAGARPRGRAVAAAFSILALAGAAVLVRFADSAAPPSSASVADKGAASLPFSEAKLEELRQEGRPVFVNFTAAWCITCIANEKVTLRLPSVKAAMKRANMAYLKGDWTRRDPVITRHLAKFGRAGVPLYVIYPPAGAQTEPLVLPQILEPEALITAIDRYATTPKPQKAEN